MGMRQYNFACDWFEMEELIGATEIDDGMLIALLS